MVAAIAGDGVAVPARGLGGCRMGGVRGWLVLTGLGVAAVLIAVVLVFVFFVFDGDGEAVAVAEAELAPAPDPAQPIAPGVAVPAVSGDLRVIEVAPPHVVAGPAPEEVPVARPAEPVRVFVAARDLSPGTLLRPADWSARVVDPLTLAPDHVPADDPLAALKLAGSVLIADLDAGALLTSSVMLRQGEPGFLAAALPAGMLGITARTPPALASTTHLAPGARVDLYVVASGDALGAERGPRVLAVASGLLVVAVASQVVGAGDPRGPGADTFTVAVPRALAPQVFWAIAEPGFGVVIRSALGSVPDAAQRAAFVPADLLGRAEDGPAGAVPEAVPVPRMVRVLRDGQGTPLRLERLVEDPPGSGLFSGASFGVAALPAPSHVAGEPDPFAVLAPPPVFGAGAGGVEPEPE